MYGSVLCADFQGCLGRGVLRPVVKPSDWAFEVAHCGLWGAFRNTALLMVKSLFISKFFTDSAMFHSVSLKWISLVYSLQQHFAGQSMINPTQRLESLFFINLYSPPPPFFNISEDTGGNEFDFNLISSQDFLPSCTILV